MALANPLWLWGLSALTVPVIIHLLSRKEGKVIAVGSLRYLKDSNTQQFKSLRLNEIVLLILRCLLIILTVLFICDLQWPQTNGKKWAVLDERLKDLPAAKSLTDSLTNQGYELHISSVHSSTEAAITSSSFWALTEQLELLSVSEAVVISAGRAEDFRGLRIAQPASLKWLTLPLPGERYLIDVTAIDKDSVLVRSGALENQNTSYTTTTAGITPGQKYYLSVKDSMSIRTTDSIRIVLASDPTFLYDQRILIASLKAVQSVLHQPIIIQETGTNLNTTDANNILVWLSEKPLPSFKNKITIHYRPVSSASLFEQQTSSDWLLTKRLNEESALNGNLALQLVEIIIQNKEAEAQANLKDQREMPEKMMWTSSTTTAIKHGAVTGFVTLDQYLILLLVAVLIAERLIAYKRNQ